MEQAGRTFIPAAGRDWRLPLYDPIVKLIGADAARQRLIEGAAIVDGHRVLDMGCGTGSLALAIGRLHPAVHLVGLDPDPKALARAARKAAAADVNVRFDQGFADALPYGEGTFDRVLSSFVFHHLGGDEKAGMLREARRVLKPGGSLHLLDFAGPDAGARWFGGRWLQSRYLLADNTEERVVARMREAGFEDACRSAGGRTTFGLIAYRCYRGTVLAEGVRHAS